MSREIGDALTAPLQERLAEAANAFHDRAIVICTVDAHGRPHPAMLSSRELFAIDARTLSLSAAVTSGTATNLRTNGHVTVILADHDGVYYIKGRAEPLEGDGGRPSLAYFRVRISEVLEDSPSAGEHARITSGIRFQASGFRGTGIRD